MNRTHHRQVARWVALGLALGGLAAPRAGAQQVPTTEPFAPQPSSPTTGGPPVSSPPSPGTPPAGLSREAQLEERIRQLEATVQRLAVQVQGAAATGRPAAAAAAAGSAAGGAAPQGTAAPDTGTPAETEAPSAAGGPGAPGQSLPPNPPAAARFNSPATLDNFRANTKFGPGFEIRTTDDEYIFQFHDLTQFDYRGYQQGGQSTIRDSFLFPRQWFMFSGRLTKPFGYFVSIANGFDTLSILDVFLDFDYDPRFRIRAGRFKTNFTYEFFVEPIQGLVVPERSIFFNNFGLNRDLGVMAFGRLFDEQLDYAVGLYNGNRNGFLDLDNSKDVAGFLNWVPFRGEENTLLENFNIGGSVFAGDQHHIPVPLTLRTIVPTTGNAIIGVPFLSYNNNVVESGMEAFWDLHAAWYYQQLAVIGEWGSGFESYALAATPNARTQVPVQSFYAQASYLLTGETRSSIGIVKPNKPIALGKGGFKGTGAIEPYFRFEYLDISNKIFTSGLSDQNLWADRVYQTWVGVNWHLTQYIKMYVDWNHSEFNQPVLFAPGRRQLTSDMFMARLQIFF